MLLFRCDETFELALELLGELCQVISLDKLYAQRGSLTFVDTINRLKEEKEEIASKSRELIDILKSYGLLEEEVKEIVEKHELEIRVRSGKIKLKMLSKEDSEETPLKIELKSKTIELDDRSIVIFEELLTTRMKLLKCEGILRKIEDIESSGKAKEVESIFNEVANLRIITRRYIDPFTERRFEAIEVVNRLAKLLCREISEHSLLPLIERLKLGEASILDALRALDFLVNEDLVDYDKLHSKLIRDSYLRGSSDFAVFMFLLAHAQKILSYKELLERINHHMWRKSWGTFYHSQEEEPLLSLSKILIIPLSLGSRVHALLALALANLVYKDRRYWYDLVLFENLCAGLMSIGRYGDDESISKLLNYSYLYGDLEAIEVIGRLANAKKSLKETLKEYKTTIS